MGRRLRENRRMTFQKQVEVLRATELFRAIPAEALKPLASHAVERRLHMREESSSLPEKRPEAFM